jgi:hypothetical protein
MSTVAPPGQSCQKNLRQPARHATTGNRIHYERRRPEGTTLYQLVQENVETFFAQVETETGSGLPDFVKDEFDAFLECGILAHGFLRLSCIDCAHEKLVAFSCKRRGFCPSCGGRRMAQTAAHLVDHIIPRVPVRQWVLSLLIPLRYLLAAHPHLLTPVLQVIHRAISTFLIKQAGLKRSEAQTGAITLIQRFGSAANLNIHLHCLVLDGVYRLQNGTAEFHNVRPPTAEQLQALLNQTIKRIMKALTRHGALIEEEGMTYLAEIETDAALSPLQSAACTYRIALGPRAGQKVLTLRTALSQNTQPVPSNQMVPRPRLNLIRFYGVLAPNAKLRAEIILDGKKSKSKSSGDNDDVPQSTTSVRISWARLLKRVFDIDIEQCPHCGGTLKIIAAILESTAITKILDHLGLPARAPPRSPARSSDLVEPV